MELQGWTIREVVLLPRRKVVKNSNSIPSLKQSRNCVAPDEPRPTGDQDSLSIAAQDRYPEVRRTRYVLSLLPKTPKRWVNRAKLRMPLLATRKSRRMRIFAIIGTGLAVLVSQAYYAVTLTPYNHTLSTVVFGVFLPLLLGCLLLAATGQWVNLLAYVGLFLSVVDDIPVLFDWPRLSGFPPGVSHFEMQIWLYILTGLLLIGSTTLALLESNGNPKIVAKAYLLTLLAFCLCFIDDLPLAIVDYYTNSAWYPFDILQHLGAVLFLGLALTIIEKDQPMKGSALTSQKL